MGNRPANRVPPTRTPTPRNENPPPDAFRADRYDHGNMRAALEASLHDAPLPLGWNSAFDSKGQEYFIDHLKKTTTYDDPRINTELHRVLGRSRSKKPRGRPPAYELNLYSRSQRLVAQLHQHQNDSGQLDLHVSRSKLFQQSVDLLASLDTLTLTRRLFIHYEGEPGLDYGGMSREWFQTLSEEFFKPERRLFRKVQKGQAYDINPYSSINSRHLEEFNAFGILLGMAIYHGKLFYAAFCRNFCKALLGGKFGMEELKDEDHNIYQSLIALKKADDISSWDLDFTLMIQDQDGNAKMVELKPKGSTVDVTMANKDEYIQLVLTYYANAKAPQLEAIRAGFQRFVPHEFLLDFTPEELEELVCGNSEISLPDLKENVEYAGDFTESSPTIKMFWEVVASFSGDDLKLLVQFVTGTSKVPIGGFRWLYGSNGPQKFTINSRKTFGLPTAHSCFNRLDLSKYTEKERLRKDLLIAIHETKGFTLE